MNKKRRAKRKPQIPGKNHMLEAIALMIMEGRVPMKVTKRNGIHKLVFKKYWNSRQANRGLYRITEEQADLCRLRIAAFHVSVRAARHAFNFPPA